VWFEVLPNPAAENRVLNFFYWVSIIRLPNPGIPRHSFVKYV
jgi:hypothetical protein